MSGRFLVSAIIIFLNAEQFLEEAITSVLAQSYNNWELLLVDDGSTDGSTAIAQHYAESYPSKICYLEHENHANRGMSASRNRGISYTRGEYIAFLDADDVWMPSKLEKQVAILDLQPEAAMVYGPTLLWYSWTGNSKDAQRDSMRKLGVQSDRLYQPPALVSLFLRGEALPPSTCGVLVRREAIAGIRGFEEAFPGLYEDQVFFYKMCLKNPVFVMQECLDMYRQHPDSYCSIAASTGPIDYEQPHSACLTFLNWLAVYLLQQEIENAEVWQALQKALWPYHHPKLYRLLRVVPYLWRQKKAILFLIARQTLPIPLRRWLQIQWQGYKSSSPIR